MAEGAVDATFAESLQLIRSQKEELAQLRTRMDVVGSCKLTPPVAQTRATLYSAGVCKPRAPWMPLLSVLTRGCDGF